MESQEKSNSNSIEEKQKQALLIIFEYLKLAQSKGVYTIEDSARIHNCISIFMDQSDSKNNT